MMQEQVDENHPFFKSVFEASTLEREAMELDSGGDAKAAASKYEAAAAKIDSGIRQHAPKGHHDIPTLNTHRLQILERAKYLKKTNNGMASPIEDHIKTVQLTMKASDAVRDAQGKAGSAGRLTAAAGLGAVAGFMVLGSFGACAGVAGGLYAVTQPGKVGDAARGASDKTIEATHGAMAYNDKHQLTNKAFNLGKSLINKAKEVNEKHDITGKISSGASMAANKAKEINEKHDVTGKTGGALSSGMQKLTNSLNKKKSE